MLKLKRRKSTPGMEIRDRKAKNYAPASTKKSQSQNKLLLTIFPFLNKYAVSNFYRCIMFLILTLYITNKICLPQNNQFQSGGEKTIYKEELAIIHYI